MTNLQNHSKNLNLTLPKHKIIKQIMLAQELSKNPEWAKENLEWKKILIQRAKEPFYQYEPYFNRTDNKPSWQWDFLSNAKYKGRLVLAANRTGKSQIAIYELILAILGLHPCRDFPPNGIAWIIALDFPMSNQIDLPMFDNFLPSHIKAKSKYHKDERLWEINAKNRNWLVYFKSSEAGREKFQGQKLSVAVFDEEPKKPEIFAEVEARLIDEGGPWWMAATPILGTAWLKSLSEREDVFSTTASMWDNPYLPEDEVRKYAESLSEEERQVRIEGQYLVFGGKPVFNIRLLNKDLERVNKQIPAMQGILEKVA